MEKYGFVYIWYDRKHKRYYVGCHFGNINDGYICSSSNMKSAYKRRPYDFKRKILKSNIIDKKDLLEEEYKWLSMIKKSELGKKYYNLHNHHFNHWSTNKDCRTISQKISESHKNDPNWGKWSKGKKISEETKQKLREANRKQFENEEQRELRRKKSKELWSNPEYREKTTISHIGKKQSKETIDKRKTNADYKAIGEKNKGRASPNKGVPKSEEQKQKLKEAWVIRKQKYPTISEETRKKFINIVTAYDLFEKKFVKILKQEFINNKDRYCGTTSKRINT